MHLLPFLQILKFQSKPIENILRHSLKSVTNIIVTIPNDRNSQPIQKLIPNPVLLKMLGKLVLPHVNLDRQLRAWDIEVQNIILNVLLSLNGNRQPLQEIIPKMPFLCCHISPKLLRVGHKFFIIRIHTSSTSKTKPRRPSFDSLRGAFYKTHGSTRIFHSWARQKRICPIQLSRKGGIRPSFMRGNSQLLRLRSYSLLCRCPSGDVFLSAGGARGDITSCGGCTRNGGS